MLQNNPSDSESKEEKGDYRVLGAGPPFLTNNKPKIPKYPKKSEGILKTKQQEQEIEDLGDAKRKEIVGNSIDGAIVESILGKVGSGVESTRVISSQALTQVRFSDSFTIKESKFLELV